MASIQMLNPDNLAKPVAPYSNIARVKAAEFLFIAGQVGMDKTARPPPTSKGNARSRSPTSGPHSLRRAQASPTSWNSPATPCIRRTPPSSSSTRTREFPRWFAGGAYPRNTLLIVERLVREEFLIEVAAVAAL